jgi:SAM-dependent methyltransferase
MTQANRKGWDGLAETHFRNYHIDRLIAGKPLLNDLIRNEVGEVAGKSLAHLLCHIGTDTLSWALLGAKVTGVDISSESLKYARRLAKQMGISADFIQADVCEAKDRVDRKYDIVFSSTGVLCWIPDIKRYAETARHLLIDGGFLYLFDGHPFRSVFINEKGSVKPGIIQGSYFRKDVREYDHMGDYTDPDLKVPVNSYEWHWKMGELITAFCDAGMRIEFLHEFPRYFYNGYTPCDVDDRKSQMYPCTFSIKAVAV